MSPELKPSVADSLSVSGLRLPRCESCSSWHFPPRRRCGHCGSSAVSWAAAPTEGVVGESTVLRRGAGLAAGEVRHLATVRHVAGFKVVARLPEAMAPGTVVRLEMQESGAIWAYRPEI